MQKPAIITALDSASAEVVQWFDEHQDRWSYAPEGKWTAAQHLEHLTRSLKPLCKALRGPKLVLRLTFGKPNRPIRDLETVKEKYYKGLAGGFKAIGPFIPPDMSDTNRSEMLTTYTGYHQQLNKILGKWSENALDKYIVPHPALGKMMIREILYFTVIHTHHHLNILRDRYEKV